MAYSVEYYDGNYVTCYPGSNQTDNGKLQLEFNMARLVTRVTSKNFCIVNPSFELTTVTGADGSAQIEIGAGQASINGMDIIITTTMRIKPPEASGHYIIGMHIQRDEASNVIGDSIYGVTRTFEGLYVTFYDAKDETDRDVLYLGAFDWDGSTISNLEEDEDKYGRIWAEDILCKVLDPKHPNITRLNLQQYLYNLPDWYFSKEGDILYGPLEMTDGRDGSGNIGIKLEVPDADTSRIIVKAPSVGVNDENRVMKLIGTEDGTEINMGKARVYVNNTDNYAYNLTSPENINIHSNKEVIIQGDNGASIGGGTNNNQPKLTLKNHKATFTDSNSTELPFTINFVDSNNIQQTLGKAIWQYNKSNKKVSLLSTDVSYLDIVPSADFEDDLRVRDTLYIGNNSTYGSELTYLKTAQWRLGSSANVYTNMTPDTINVVNTTLGSGYIRIGNADNDSGSSASSVKLYNNGRLDLLNKAGDSKLAFLDGTDSLSTSITKTKGKSQLTYQAGTHIFGGNIDATGHTITADKIYNAVYNGFGEIYRKAIDENIEYGDIVCIRNDGLVHKVSTVKDINNIIGICSNTIGIELGGNDIPENEQVEVEMLGQIWVKTDNPDIICGQWVKALPNGKCDLTENRSERLGITISKTLDGKVRIVYNG